MSGVEGLAGIFAAAGVDGFLHARDIDGGAEIEHQADAPVVAASVFKLPVLVELFRQADAGAIDLAEQATVGVDGRAAGPTGISALVDPVTLSWRDLATWMIVVSDNAATDAVCERVGLDNVNKTMVDLDLPGTVVDTDCRGIYATMLADFGATSFDQLPSVLTREAFDALRACRPESTNRTTAREMTRLLELIWTDQVASPDSCAHMRRILQSQVWPHRLASGFPEEGVSTGGKTGTLPAIRNEVGVVTFGEGGARYAVAVFTRSEHLGLKDAKADAVIGTAARFAVDELRATPGGTR